MKQMSNGDYSEKCLYCDGYNYQCKNYNTIDENEACVWYITMESDLEKLARGDECTTFPVKEWLKEKTRE